MASARRQKEKPAENGVSENGIIESVIEEAADVEISAIKRRRQWIKCESNEAKNIGSEALKAEAIYQNSKQASARHRKPAWRNQKKMPADEAYLGESWNCEENLSVINKSEAKSESVMAAKRDWKYSAICKRNLWKPKMKSGIS